MNATIKVVLEGLPERIQEAADTLDRAFPGAIDWCRLATLGRNHSMRLEGIVPARAETQHQSDPIISRLVTGKVCKPDALAVQTGERQVARFCASLRSFQP